MNVWTWGVLAGLGYAAMGALAYSDMRQWEQIEFPGIEEAPDLHRNARAFDRFCASIWPIGWPAHSFAYGLPTAWRRSAVSSFAVGYLACLGAPMVMALTIAGGWLGFAMTMTTAIVAGVLVRPIVDRIHQPSKGGSHGLGQAQRGHNLGASGSAGQHPRATAGWYAGDPAIGASASVDTGFRCPCCGAGISEGGLLVHLRSGGCTVTTFRGPDGDLPERRTQETVTAWKRARLVVTWDGNLRFCGVMAQQEYGVEAEAVHLQSAGGFYAVNHDHPSPDPTFRWCHVCGFYGMNKDAYLETLSREYGDSTLDLEVELSGTIIAYELGYRAQRQRVLAVWVDRECRLCRLGQNVRQALAAAAVTAESFEPSPTRAAEGLRVLDGHGVIPSCSQCTPLGLVSLSEASGRLGTEVRWK